MAEFLLLWPSFLLILARVASFFTVLPLFSYRNVPVIYRVGLSLIISWMMVYTSGSPNIQVDASYITFLLQEIMIGLALGLIAYILLSAFQIAGGFIDFQMGFAVANVIDPQTGAQSPLVGQYLYTFSLLFLLSVDAHHMLLDGIYYSYQLLPLGLEGLAIDDGQAIHLIVLAFARMFMIALQMAIPVVGCLFLVDVALGIMARTVPQMNVFVVGLPLKILVSFIMLFIVMPAFFMLADELFDLLLTTMRNVMQALEGME
ncbi:flagellar type III secretion system protein FliR [Bacillaceae bacterium SIJ1]|uniref:flagellar biosynthetic protein FliR n=1 Tax=Litoribacterium kuwaitense TaxID=1398745 RepID=UPI0013ED24B9|nr:flagellar biosynthetic protein FliR [Litoribacterium kuwaitense]NGP44112.1 flagellar type III secretion system protein FliR [Litoribacterium kuwaitense]